MIHPQWVDQILRTVLYMEFADPRTESVRQLAADCLAEARIRFSETSSDKVFDLNFQLPESAIRRIDTFLEEFSQAADSRTQGEIPFEDLRELSARFEIGLTKTGMPIPLNEQVVLSAHQQLAGEFLSSRKWFNEHKVALKSARLIRAILFNQPPISQIFEETEFSELVAQRPYYLAKAIETKPRNPRALIRERESRTASLLASEEFDFYQERPSLVRNAAWSRPQDPESLLEDIKTAWEDILSREEYSDFHDIPGTLLHFLIGHRRDPHGDLEKVIDHVNQVLANPDFAWAWEREAFVTWIAMNYPTRVEQKLRTLPHETRKLRDEAEFADLPDGMLFRAAITNPKDPAGFLRKTIQLKDALCIEFPEFSETPGFCLEVAMSYPRSARSRMSLLCNAQKTLDNSDQKEWIDQHSWVALRAIRRSPKAPVEFVRRVRSVLGALEENPALETLQDDKELLLVAAAAWGEGAADVLRGHIGLLDQVSTDPQFILIRDVPWLVREALISYGPGAGRRLLSAIQCTQEAIKAGDLECEKATLHVINLIHRPRQAGDRAFD